MNKILVIGVGGAGRETVKHMKDTGIPEADYVTFGKFEDDDEIPPTTAAKIQTRKIAKIVGLNESTISRIKNRKQKSGGLCSPDFYGEYYE